MAKPDGVILSLAELQLTDLPSIKEEKLVLFNPKEEYRCDECKEVLEDYTEVFKQKLNKAGTGYNHYVRRVCLTCFEERLHSGRWIV